MIKYQGKTIVGLAHERGANGHITKKATAWQYLINHHSLKPKQHRGGCRATSYPDLEVGYWKYGDRRDAVASAHYSRLHWENRINLNGNALCHAHGYQLRTETPGELLPMHIIYRSLAPTAIEYIIEHGYTLDTLPRAPQDWNDPAYYLCIAGRIIKLHRNDNATWDNKKSHWPSSSTITRTATLLSTGWDDLSKTALLELGNPYMSYGYEISTFVQNNTERKINYEARGNWILKIITDLLGITPERQRGLSHIQIDPHYRVERIRKIAGVEIWRRTLAGETIDYCAVQGKDTYHTVTPREAVHGLSAKLATPGSRREIIDMDYALALGFCRTGVEQFCDDYNLDCAASYNRAEIQSLIKAGNGRAEKYSRDLIKAGFTID